MILATVIEGNLIGVGANGTIPVGNTEAGIVLGRPGLPAENVLVGGIGSDDGNVISQNAIDVLVLLGCGHAILGNSIYENAVLGIDLDDDGVTLNDSDDIDAGPNDLLNFPVVTSAEETAGTVTIDFDLDVLAGDYRVEVFTKPSGADATGHGEGETYEKAATITHTGSGVESFQTTYTGSADDIVTLTAT